MNQVKKVAIAGLLAVLVTLPLVAIAEERLATIRVSGQGEVVIAPDMALISVGVVEEAKTAREALTANNEAMNKVFAAMKKQGIADKDLQTSGLNISPNYYYPPVKKNEGRKPPVITGYTVSNNIAVRIRDLSKVGVILDQAVTLGVNSGCNIQFTNSDTTEVYTQARQKAMADAIAKAKTLTNAAGADTGRILSISENSRSPRPMPMANARFKAMESADASVPVAGGENTYMVTVNVEWEIDQ